MNALEQMMQTLGIGANAFSASQNAGEGTPSSPAAAAFASIVAAEAGQAPDAATAITGVATETVIPAISATATAQDYITIFGSLTAALQQLGALEGQPITEGAPLEPGFDLGEVSLGDGANITDPALTAEAEGFAVTFANVAPVEGSVPQVGLGFGDTLDIPVATGHFLPTDDLIALSDGEIPESFNIFAGAAQAPAAAAAAAPTLASGQQPAPDAATAEAGLTLAGAPKPAETFAPLLPADADAATDAKPAALPEDLLAALEPADLPADQAQTAEALAAANAQTAADEAQQAEADAAAGLVDAGKLDDAAEASALAAQQAANTNKDSGAQPAKKSSNGSTAASAPASHSDTVSADTKPTAAAAAAAAQHMDSRAPKTDDIARPIKNDVATPVPAREISLALTPERLAGYSDGSATESVAAGLSGLRGEAGTAGGATLLAGKPSPTFAAHVAQNFNLQVSRAVNAGNQEFSIQMDPAELGKVQVRLQFTKAGEVRAQVMVERPETLDLLQRDTRGLEKAIEANGQKLGDGGLEFSLDNGSEQSAGRAFAEALQQEKMRDQLAAMSGTNGGIPVSDDAAMEAIPLDQILPYVTAETGVDIRV